MEQPKLQIQTQENYSQDDLYKYMKVESDNDNNSRFESDFSDDQRYENTGFRDLSIRDGDNNVGDGDEEQGRVGELYSLDSVPLEGYDKDPKNPNTTEFKKYKISSRIFFIISIISALLILAFETYMYAVINIHKVEIGSPVKYKEISIYLALFIFASIFQVIISFLGLKTKNILLLCILCIFYACMLIYTGIQYQEINKFVGKILTGNWKTATRAMNISAIVVIAITMISQIYLIVFHLNNYVNWFSFKTIGGDLKIKRLYQIFQIHRSLLIFSFFFFLEFTIQFIIIMVNSIKKVEFILTIIVLPLTIILLILSDFSITREILSLSIICLIIYFGGLAYVLFKVIRLYTKYTSAYYLTVKPGDYFPGRTSLLTFGIITMFFLLGIIITEIILLINFKKGLKTVTNTRYFKKQPKEIGKESDEISIMSIS